MGRYFETVRCQLKAILVFLIILSFLCPIYAQEPDWLIKLRNLKVFESKKEQVEKEFGYPKVIDSSNYTKTEKKGWSEYIEYETKDGYLEVVYSNGNCAEIKSPIGFDVNSGIVVTLRFEPFEPVEASILNFDFKKFDVARVSDVPGLYTYKNKESGIEMTISKAKVFNIEFDVPSKYVHLDCEKVLKEKAK